MGSNRMGLSFSSWKKSAPAAGTGGDAGGATKAPVSPARNRAMLLIAVLGLGVLGYKMFWPESEPLKAKAAMTSPKPTAPRTAARGATGANSARDINQNLPRLKNRPSAGAAGAAQSADETDVPPPTEIRRGSDGRPLPSTRPMPNP